MNNNSVPDFLVPTKMDVVVNLSFDQDRCAGEEVATRTAVQTLTQGNVSQNLVEMVTSGTSLHIPKVHCCVVTDAGTLPIITEEEPSSDNDNSDDSDYHHFQSTQDYLVAHQRANQRDNTRCSQSSASSSASTHSQSPSIKLEHAGAFMVHPQHPDPSMLPPPELPSPLNPIQQPTDYYFPSLPASSLVSAELDSSMSSNLSSSSSSSLHPRTTSPTATATAYLTTTTPSALHASASSTPTFPASRVATDAAAAAASAARAAIAASAAVNAALAVALANAAIEPPQPANDNPTSLSSAISPSSLTNTLGVHAAFRARMLAQGYTLVQLRDSRGRYRRGPYQYVHSEQLH
jgi:hypothetical protein